MNRSIWLGLLLLPAGCLSTPPADNPQLLRGSVNDCENPVLISPGQPSPAAYAEVFEKVLSNFGDYFEIAYANRYDGRIIGAPKIAPGLERPWVTGSPELGERIQATFQTMRYRGHVQIRSAEQGGYLVQVTVYRELKDEGRPINAPTGSVFRDAPTVDRQYEVVDPAIASDDRWIPKGRALDVEDAILKHIRRCQFE